LKPLTAAGLWAQVKANRDRLDGCKRHRFPAEVPGIEQGVGGMFGRKIECLNCKGMMDLVALNYYVRGFEAAGGDPNSVLPGWREEGGSSERRFFKDDSAG
jgi:hypothetical protein